MRNEELRGVCGRVRGRVNVQLTLEKTYAHKNKSNNLAIVLGFDDAATIFATGALTGGGAALGAGAANWGLHKLGITRRGVPQAEGPGGLVVSKYIYDKGTGPDPGVYVWQKDPRGVVM